MFCGGSFRAKVIDQNDEYKVVSVNNTKIKIFRSKSFANGACKSQKSRVYISPPTVSDATLNRINFAAKAVRFYYVYFCYNKYFGI